MRWLENLRQLSGRREKEKAASEAEKRRRVHELVRLGCRHNLKPGQVDELDRLNVELGLSAADVDRLAALFKREAELEAASASLADAQQGWADICSRVHARFLTIEADTTDRYLAGVLENGQFAPVPELWRAAHPERESAYIKLQSEMSLARSRVMLARRAPGELARLKAEHPEVFAVEGGGK